MALASAIDEDDWVLQSQGNRSESSTTASTYETITMTWTVSATEYKYFSVDLTVAQAYIAANPTLDLTIEMIPGFTNGCHLLKRTETRTLTSVTSGSIPS